MGRSRGASAPEDLVVISPHRGIELSFTDRFRVTVPLVRAWTARDLRVRYRQSVLRSAWSLVQPLIILVTYGWVLTTVLDVQSEDAPYLTFAWAGIVPFTFFSQALGSGVGSIQQSGPVISRLAFPREVLPLAVVGGALVDLGIMLVTLIATSWIQVAPPTIHLVGLLPVLVVLVLWTTAITVAAASVTVFRRDLNFAIPLVLRVLFIATPVMYAASLIAVHGQWLVDANPLAVVIEGTRDVVYRAVWPDWELLGVHMAVGGVLLVGAFLLLRSLEPRMTDHA